MPFPNNVDVIVHIGAGRCEELPTYLATSAKRIILVEPNARLAAELRTRCNNEPRVSILAVAVSNATADDELTEYNLSDANSLYPPTDLRKLYPGLRVLGRQSVRTVTGEELLKECELTSDQNALIIQAPGAELGIIESMTESGGIDQFCYLAVTCAETPLYASASDSNAVLKILQEQGFDLVRRDNTDPDWPVLILHHNALKQKLADLTIRHQRTSHKLKRAQKDLEAEKEKNENPDSAIFKLEQELKRYKESLSKAKQELSAGQNENKRLSAELSKLKQEIKKYKDEQSKASGGAKPTYTATDFENLEKRLEYFFGQHTLQLEQAANALGRHVTSTVTNTAKELEAGIALQQQFGRDLPSLEEHGGKLPAAVALQLSRQLRSTPYDVIIEFGSGVTTRFMAHTLRNQPINEKTSESLELAPYIDASDDDLPKRIVCFENNRTKYNELIENLKKNGLAPIVQLQFAPLVHVGYQGQQYLFFDCKASLRRLGQLFEGREARLLVSISQLDERAKISVAPALQQVLQYLSAHRVDIFLINPESGLLQRWEEELRERELEYNIAGDCGGDTAALIRINP